MKYENKLAPSFFTYLITKKIYVIMITKVRKDGIVYDYDTEKKKYFNPKTKKWVINVRQSKGKSKGKSIGKSITKIKQSRIKFRYYLFNIDIPYNNINIKERINFFLTKVERKYQAHKHKDIFAKSSYDEKHPYFSIKELILLLGVEWNTYIELLVRYDYIKHNKKRKDVFETYGKIKYLKKDDNFHLFIPTPKLLQVKKQEKLIEVANVYKSIGKYYKILEKNLGDYKSIYKMVCNSKFIITKEQFIKEITNKYYNDYSLRLKNKTQTLEQYIDNSQFLYNMIVDFNSGNDLTNLEYFKVDKFSGRVHSIFTYLGSEFMKYNNKVNYEIDLHQSQMTILASLLQEEIGDNTFTDDVNNGIDIYEKIQKLLNLPNRKTAKDFMFKMIFGGIGKGHKLFKEIYPDVEPYIYEIKTTYNRDLFLFYKKSGKKYKPYASFVMKLQKKETEIFKKIWTLVNIHQSKIPMATRHDSIVVPFEYKEIGINIINNVLDQELKCNYKLNIK